jgi:uncharacterized protein YutE (UPF0331/DUF86 family)
VRPPGCDRAGSRREEACGHVAAVADLRRLARPDAIRHDVREERFIEHTLQLAIQAALDVASHIASDEAIGEPRTNRELFDLLARAGWLDPALAAKLSSMAGFRNVLVHGYDTVDLSIVEDVVRHRLDDLLQFVTVVTKRL